METLKSLFNTLTSPFRALMNNNHGSIDYYAQFNQSRSQALDVHRTRHLLVFRLGLPTELADMIIDFAEYYPVLPMSFDTSTRPLTVEGNWRLNSAALLHVIHLPIPQVKQGKSVKVKKVLYRIESHDQGWGGDPGCQNTYNGSYTWFEASILRPNIHIPANPRFFRSSTDTDQGMFWNCPTQPEFLEYCEQQHFHPLKRQNGEITWHVQSNLTANSEWRNHEIEWRDDEECEAVDGCGDGGRGEERFVNLLRSGDVVIVWTRAMYPGWVNHVRKLQLEIMFKV